MGCLRRRTAESRPAIRAEARGSRLRHMFDRGSLGSPLVEAEGELSCQRNSQLVSRRKQCGQSHRDGLAIGGTRYDSRRSPRFLTSPRSAGRGAPSGRTQAEHGGRSSVASIAEAMRVVAGRRIGDFSEFRRARPRAIASADVRRLSNEAAEYWARFIVWTSAIPRPFGHFNRRRASDESLAIGDGPGRSLSPSRERDCQRA